MNRAQGEIPVVTQALNELRAMTDFEALNALQRMRAIADAGSATSAEVADEFLSGSGTKVSAAEMSGSAPEALATGRRLQGGAATLRRGDTP